ncbi:NmrA domain-containing protein [Fusarium falciforme]|uniref:NmrA domain-containing protein n=1 Tax=Fusarium falciforme TaxID=195108 RepID=UPI002301561E|nr:NmrA domain-containing protein [Fusarium falciforme]WAO87485.1 NmrA domain-containing protein [Fusarium falciforme]
MSSTVAVAGGTGGLGRALIEAILADGKFDVVILARKYDEEKEKQIGARILQVDYTNIEALTKVLEDLSTEPEFNLIAAADKSTPTKRYVGNVWGVDYTDEFVNRSPLFQAKHAVTDALDSTSLEHTVWYTGYFADYYLMPHAKSYLNMMTAVVDMANNTAAIPGSGNVPVVFTYTQDVARYVAASLTLPRWSSRTWLVGDKVTWNEVVALAESAKGVKFNVTYDSVETMKAGRVTALPSHLQMRAFIPQEVLEGILSLYGLLFEAGVFDLNPEHTIRQDFPEIKVKTFKELITEAWGRKS